MTDKTDLRRKFHRLHESGCFVIPNPWDIGSARLLAQLGFKALATTSAGFAWSQGVPDNHVSLEQVLAHCHALVDSVEVPVSADFEGGFAVAPEDVARNVSAAISTGLAGLSIEDSSKQRSEPLFDFGLAVERIVAAREAIVRSGTGALLTARSEGFVAGRPDLDETIRRLTAYAEAGADCLFAPGIRSTADIKTVVAAVAPKPVNVVVGGDFATAQELALLGVRRISVGGSLARVALTGFLQAATEIAEFGTFKGLGRAMTGVEINDRFRADRPS
jgi:methylisocitrate lyase